MANGWESKSVADQQVDLQEQPRSQESVADVKAAAQRANAEQARKVQALKLTRARISEQLSRSNNERYTSLLNTELTQIDGELEKLG